MKLTFIGAAHEVTGSCHLLQAAGKNILIDCGMEQGPVSYTHLVRKPMYARVVHGKVTGIFNVTIRQGMGQRM